MKINMQNILSFLMYLPIGIGLFAIGDTLAYKFIPFGHAIRERQLTSSLQIHMHVNMTAIFYIIIAIVIYAFVIIMLNKRSVIYKRVHKILSNH